MLFRMIFSLPGAVAITALLFLAMAALVRRDAGPTTTPPPQIASILATMKPTDPKPPKFKRPDPIEAPDAPVTDFPDPQPRPGGGGGPIGIVDLGDDPIGIDLPYIPRPVYRTAPPYPENCRSRGIEGSVVVGFDVTPQGDVINARVVASDNGCLNATALRTVEKWKYNPRIEDGRAVAQRGLTEAFAFELEG
jgi:protein TonB